jgi:hypothetical protein
MRTLFETAGELLAVDSGTTRFATLIEETLGGAPVCAPSNREPTVVVRVEHDSQPFDVAGWNMLARDAWCRDGAVVMVDACTSGFDLRLRTEGETPEFTYRWRPPARTRLAALALAARARLLARAVLLQYPALWWASTRGRVPMHASAFSGGGVTPLVSGPSGVGKSTLLAAELEAGARAASDNLCVGNGEEAWGVVEPMRLEGAGGRRMPHGRREAQLPNRVGALEPDCVVLLQRDSHMSTRAQRCDAGAAARSLTSNTYMAGELRRYWGFAAALSAGSGIAPVHPPILEVSATFAQRLPCFEVVLSNGDGVRLAELLGSKETTWI